MQSPKANVRCLVPKNIFTNMFRKFIEQEFWVLKWFCASKNYQATIFFGSDPFSTQYLTMSKKNWAELSQTQLSFGLLSSPQLSLLDLGIAWELLTTYIAKNYIWNICQGHYITFHCNCLSVSCVFLFLFNSAGTGFGKKQTDSSETVKQEVSFNLFFQA